jgi:hypothetical protein
MSTHSGAYTWLWHGLGLLRLTVVVTVGTVRCSKLDQQTRASIDHFSAGRSQR